MNLATCPAAAGPRSGLLAQLPLALVGNAGSAAPPVPPLRAVVIDGQSNHDFRGTTESVRGTLASTRRFGDWSTVLVSRCPVGAEPAESRKPRAAAAGVSRAGRPAWAPRAGRARPPTAAGS